jgi:adenylate cyclase
MKYHCKVFLLFLTTFFAANLYAQKQSLIDSLLVEIPKSKTDKQKASLMNDVSYAYSQSDATINTSIDYAEKALVLAQKNGWKDVASRSWNILGNNYQRKKNYTQALEYYLKALKVYEDVGNKKNIANITNNIGLLHHKSNNFPKAIEYYQTALKINEDMGNKKGIIVVTGNMGNTYSEQKNYTDALDYLQRALKLNEDIDDKQAIAKNATTIGNLYKNQGNDAKALEFYQKALKINETLGKKNDTALNSSNIGSIYFSQKNSAKALEYYSKAQNTYEDAGNKDGAARNSGNMGITYLRMVREPSASESEQQEALQQAISKLDFAIKQLDEAGSSSEAKQQFIQSLASARNITIQGVKAAVVAKPERKDTVISKDEIKRSRMQQSDLRSEYARKQDSLKLENRNKELTLRKEMDLQHLKFEYERKQALAKTDEEREQLRHEEETKRQQIENDYHTLIRATKVEQELAQAQQEKKNAIAQAEIKRQKSIKNASFAGGLGILLLAFIIYRNYRSQKKSNKLISEANRIILIEKQRSEELLLNILPQEVAEELKLNGKTDARFYNEVSVLFTDFVNFTYTAEKLTPQQLVNELHECFSAFDAIIERNGLEKIKTIGDAYMAVCGLPESTTDHAHRVIKAAIEIHDFINERKKQEKVFEIRIGINSGQVVAGIVGVKKFAYDIWGDAVNTAARMEQCGESGKINISQSTYELVKKDFNCVYRGKIKAKNKGEIDMYFVDV